MNMLAAGGKAVFFKGVFVECFFRSLRTAADITVVEPRLCDR